MQKCKNDQLEPINELIKKFSNTHKFCNNDLSKIFLLLRKGVYPYEYMDSWERFNETALPNKKAFYSELIWKILLIKTTHMLKKYLKNLG